MQSLREIFWESKRAPSINTTIIKNPYRREFLNKKFYGKTSEERKATKKFLKDSIEANKIKVEREELGLNE